MKGNLTAYRVMATIVGVLLIVLCLIGLPLHYGYLISDAGWLAEPAIEGVNDTAGWGWRLGSDISAYLGVAHGWLYLIFLITAFLLSRKAKWDIGFTVVTLICGTIPVLSFWAEHRAVKRVKAEYPALV
ncbi:DUF3817 domain-containing protein [Nocardioides insulae]|uniref:DUF3817 domain-containing protein n=1 Tax=Nocardioides insulae TaxID=394734 RepID=UPI0003F94019|nr:DUF3817 domain-containing protein [Nocardioides insulae]